MEARDDLAVSEDEEPLSGGTLTGVVRVGSTVRRTAHHWSGSVQALLGHARRHGFVMAPEPLGFDGEGREVLSYVPGETCGWSLPWPAWVRSDVLLREVGAALAGYHRVTADFASDVAAWNWQARGRRAGEVVCHNDLAPYNVVVRDGHLAAIIDWDLAGPGPAVSDLAFTAWQWVPLHGPMVSAALGWDAAVDRVGRMRLLLDAYGLADRSGFVGAVVERIGHNRRVMLERADAGDPAYSALVSQGHVAGMDEALGYLASEGDRLQYELDAL